MTGWLPLSDKVELEVGDIVAVDSTDENGVVLYMTSARLPLRLGASESAAFLREWNSAEWVADRLNPRKR
jgi:hypothetical protein